MTNGRKTRRSDFKYDWDDYLSLEGKKIQFQEDPTLKSKEGLPLNKTGLINLSLDMLKYKQSK